MNNSNILKLTGKVYSDSFYGGFLTELNSFIKRNKKGIIPTISLEEVEWIDSTVLPILLITGRILKSYYVKPIPLLLSKHENVKQIMAVSHFYTYAQGMRNYNDYGSKDAIFIYDSNDAYSYPTDKKSYNPHNGMSVLVGMKGYYELDSKQQEILKYRIQDEYESFSVGNYFGMLLAETLDTNGEVYDACIKSIAELMCNATLYSLSYSYISVQMISHCKYTLSISDSGIGFYESLKRKGINPIESKEAVEGDAPDESIWNDYYALFTALNRSEHIGRTNLWRLITITCKNGGIVCIHTGKLYIIFNHKGLLKANYKAYNYMSLLLREFSNDYSHSLLRIYSASLKGVHIEIRYGQDRI